MRKLEIYIFSILIFISYIFNDIGSFTDEPILTVSLSLSILVYVSLKLFNLKMIPNGFYSRLRSRLCQQYCSNMSFQI